MAQLSAVWKTKGDKMFAHHYIRSNLLDTWSRYLKRLGEQKPLCISPLEMLNLQIKSDQVLSYQDFIDCKTELKKLKSREEMPIKIDWFQYCQIQNLIVITGIIALEKTIRN